jgi:hypothetical protein
MTFGRDKALAVVFRRAVVDDCGGRLWEWERDETAIDKAVIARAAAFLERFCAELGRSGCN